jgi:MFS family permease
MNSKEENIILEHIYGNKEYQRRILFISCMIWGLLDVFSLSLGLLEIKPVVDVYDSKGILVSHGPLAYEYCDNPNFTYTIKEKSLNSIVNYFSIYCDKYLVAFIGSFNFLGVFLGTLVSPFIIDHFGRRNPTIIPVGLYSILIFLSTFAQNIQTMYLYIFLCGFTNLISHIAVFLLLNEVTRKEKRSMYSSIIFNSFAMFGIIYVWTFFYIQDWKSVFYIISVSCIFLSVLCHFFIKESPRYLLLKKDPHFREKMLRRIFNYGKEVEYFAEIYEEKTKKRLLNLLDKEDDSKLVMLRESLIDKTSEESELCKEIFVGGNAKDKFEESNEIEPQHFQNKEKHILDLITNKNINYIFLTMCFMWFCISGSYYGILIMAKDIKGNVYWTYSMMYMLEIFSNIIASIMMDHPELGRKKSLSILFFLAVIVIFFKLTMDISEHMVIFLIGLRFLISIIYSIIYVYCIESYPTDLRAKGLAFNAVFGRFSSILVPFIVEVLQDQFFFLIFIIFSISFLLSFVLKETYNTELEQYTKS